MTDGTETKPAVAAVEAKPEAVKPAEKVEPKAEEPKAEEAKAAEKRERDEAAAAPAAEEPAAKRQRNLPLDLATNRGVLFTSPNKFFAKQGAKDVMYMLGRAVSGEEKKERVEGEKKEQKKDANASTAPHFEHMKQLSKLPCGSGFVRFPEGTEAPTAIVDKLMQNVLDKKEKSTNIARIHAIDHMCAPNLDAFTKLAEQVVRPLFLDADGKKVEREIVWALAFKQRGMKTFDKVKALKVLDQWTEGRKVSLDNPDVCIQIELNPVFCGVSLLSGWKKFDKYNFTSLMNPEKAEAERKAMQKQQQELLKAKAEKEAREAAPAAEEKGEAAPAVAEKKGEAAPAVAEKKEEAAPAVEEKKE